MNYRTAIRKDSAKSFLLYCAQPVTAATTFIRSARLDYRVAAPVILCMFAVLGQGCATTPQASAEKPTLTQQAQAVPNEPTESAETPPPADQSAAPCICQEPVPSPTQTTPPPEQPPARFSAASWEDLPNWGAGALAPSLVALLQTCAAIGTQPVWQPVCTDARNLPEKSKNRKLQEFFEDHFTPYQVINGNGSVTGLITGYYEPVLSGSRTRSERYRFPLYSQPDDLLTIDLSNVYPELKHKRLRGRLQGNRVVPYYSREEIEINDPPLKGKELVWVDDPVDAFFLQIQGSGQVKLDDGEIMRVGYADQNGYPFRSVGRYLIQQKILRPEQVSMQGIRAWAQKNPDKLDSFLNFNPSYVFFRELPLNLPGPIGSLGVPLTAAHSIAVDRRSIPLGVPVYLSTTWPYSSKPLNRLMLAQDTGGAINGGVRADFYWGPGDEAGRLAGMMKQSGRMWVLLPKGFPVPGNDGPRK